MPQLLHAPTKWVKWFRRTFSLGSNTDVRPEGLKDGLYADALNMRPVSVDGNTGALEAVKGEAILYTTDNPNASTYTLIGSAYTNGHEVEFWASSAFNDPNPGDNPPIIKIDGDIAAQSPLIPYTFDRPLQIAVVERCRSGVLYPADHQSDPLFWDIQAMLDALSSGSQAFFGGFNPNSVSVGLLAPATFPILSKTAPLIDLGGPIGLPVGQYSYAIRYVTLNGDRTNWGPESPLIPVPTQYAPNDTLPGGVYPGGRTIGAFADTAVRTRFGINLLFRLDNQYGYQSIEIKRRSYNDGQGLLGTGIEEVVARIPVSQGDVSIGTYVDPSDSNILEVIGDGEAAIQILNIKAPKGVDYSDGRLKYANFMLTPQDVELTFDEVDGAKMVPITRKLINNVNGFEVPDGYCNPYHATYFKSAGRGELYGYGVQLWNGAQGKYPVVDIPGLENFQYPNRGDIKGANGNYGADSLVYSDDPCYAANVTLSSAGPEGPVGATFEATTQGNRAKTDTFSPLNVQQYTGNTTPGEGVCRDGAQFFQWNPDLPPGFNITLDAPSATTVVIPSPSTGNGYEPWKPVNNQDPEDSYLVPPNVSRLRGPAASALFSNQITSFNPADAVGKAFAPTYHALGGLLYGIQDIPKEATALTIARTAPAGRVVMQGMGTYILQPNSAAPAGKVTNALYVHFPDFAAGIVDQATIDSIIQNPADWKIQVVAGRGFYTETYAYSGEAFADPFNSPWCGPCIGANIMDAISYARIQYDSGEVNVAEAAPGGMGYNPIVGSPAPNNNYVGIDKWRRNGAMQPNSAAPNYSYWQESPDGGNAILDIASMVPVQDGRSNYFRITTQQFVYSPETASTSFDTNFAEADGALRNFHGPWLVVNLIRENASVPLANITPYVNTGVNIAMSTCIGIYTGDPETSDPQQDFELIGEREHSDCLGYLPTDYRYCFVQDASLGERRYVCITNNTLINLTAALSDIATFGFWTAPDGEPVYGVYEVVTNNNFGFSLRMGGFGTAPAIGSRVIIKYDHNAPIRVFGHDMTIGPSIHAVYDRLADRDNLQNAVPIGGLPLPYAGFVMNPRVFIPEQGTQTEEQIGINYLISFRQWCVVWDAESRVQPSLYVNANATPDARADEQQFFPAMHYVMRPMRNITYAPGSNNFYPQYDTDYPNEWQIFNYGGLRFRPAVNLDYAKQPPVTFFGLPKAGFLDPLDYCTGIAASNEFDPLLQDSPGLRTFLAQNLKVISDENGEIKVIATYLGPAGQNTVAWTQRGVCRVLTNKNILTGASGEQISTQSISNYWGEEMWLTRNIGSPDQLWRLWSKGYATAGDSYMDTFYWPDRKGWYRMRNDTIDDIARGRQLKRLLPILKELPTGYTPQMSAFYNTKYQEMWATISAYTSGGTSKPPVLLVYSPQTNEWLGEYSYRFDGYVNTPDDVLGMRDLTTWTLDTGYTISGSTREAWVYLPVVGEVGNFKEAVRWRAVGDKPDAMLLYDKDGVLMSEQSEAIQEAFDPGTGALWAKLYDSYEGWWWRTMTSYDPERKLPQDVRFFVKVLYNTSGDKQLTALENQLKNIR